MLNTASVVELNRHFGIPGVAEVAPGSGGMTRVQVRHPKAQGEIYLHGGHVTSWIPSGLSEVLFVSGQAQFREGKAIRGGIPICFPWFGNKAEDAKAPAHGFVRTMEWKLESIKQDHAGVSVRLYLETTSETLKLWPANFRAVYSATFGEELRLELLVTNTDTSSPCRFEEALHTYYRVGDIEAIKLSGLNGSRYLDKTDGNKEKVQVDELVVSSETDRVFLESSGEIRLVDASLRRRIVVTKQNSMNTVTWNPWVEKAHELNDFGDDEWNQMVCIEAANVGGAAVELQPRQDHRLLVITRVEEL